MATNLLTYVIFAVTAFEACVTEATSVQCGTTIYTLPLITEGTKTLRGEWPFLAALFLAQENKFFCGGTILSSKHVLTAAHCVREKYSTSKRLPADIVVLLGAYDLTSRVERGVQLRDIEEIHIHPEWQSRSEKYDADLAILLLSEIIVFTNYIRPVCLPAEDTAFDNVTGSVVGWGLTETGPNQKFMKHTSVTALNGIYCLTEHPNVAQLSSTRTFCGRGVNEKTNQGDSGGGFYVLKGSAWVQYGIVSAISLDATRIVDANTIVVYSNILKFKNWITDTVGHYGATGGEPQANAATKIILECVFVSYVEDKYGCWVDNLDIRDNNTAVASFTGSHQINQNDHDVEWIQFRSGTMYFIPSGIGQIFRNLKIFQVKESVSTKRISRSEFKGFENLVELVIKKNDITTLDYDSLMGLQRLEEFTCEDNSLTEIDGRTFETNTKLRKVWLRNNNIAVLPRWLFARNLLLEVVGLQNNFLTIIDGTTFATNAKLREVHLDDNKIEIVPRNLFARNLLLESVHLSLNSLKIIDVGFTPFTSIKQIWLRSNICINAFYTSYNTYETENRFTNVSEFQNQIRNNCQR